MLFTRLIAAIAVFAALFIVLWGKPHVEQAATPAIGGNFNLTSQHNQAVQDADFRGRYMLVFFGYTTCPDICPLGVGNIDGALRELGGHGEDIVPIFITVDPKRDTPETLGRYFASLDKRWVALTGSREALTRVAGEYKVYAEPASASSAATNAHMDHGGLISHSALIYLMGKDGSYLAHFANDTPPKALADGIAKRL